MATEPQQAIPHETAIRWLSPEACDPPHRVTHPEHYEALRDALRSGWEADAPACLGYLWDERVQLISGSHRWAACRDIGQKIPVAMLSYEWVKSIWGTDAWLTLIANPPKAGDAY